MSYIIAIDEGTTSTRAVLYNVEKNVIERIESKSLDLFYPKTLYVEQDANQIYDYTKIVLDKCIEKVGQTNVLGICITNQRESVVAWDKNSGKPLYNCIIWQCRRTKKYCEQIEKKYGRTIKNRTGLKVDPYFSASKIRWLLDNVAKVKRAKLRNSLNFGTIDSYLVFRLTKGKKFVTDYTNASRTMLYNIKTFKWDSALLKIFGIDINCLPKVVDCDSVVGEYDYQGTSIKICGIAGDQQSSLIGHCGFDKGQVKITYGTGMFMLMNVGDKMSLSKKGLVTTLGYGYKKPCYVLEGSVFNAGSSVQWLRDQLNFFEFSSQSEDLALSVKDTNGVYVVPAFTGLGAPYWNSGATGLITGITRATTKAHVTRAVLESMTYSAKDITDIMIKEGKTTLNNIYVDGGACNNNFLMQYQSNVLNCEIERPCQLETTALGVIYLCMIALNIVNKDNLTNLNKTNTLFKPNLDGVNYNKKYKGWKKAVERCMYE